jgi:nucleotide-binding universal stress UspA family protein
MSFKRILLPIDGSPQSIRSVRVGLELAQVLGAKVATVFVVEPQLGLSGEFRQPDGDVVELTRQDNQLVLAGVHHDTDLPDDAEHFFRLGHAAEAIGKAARDWDADLIVMGSHGRGSLGRALLGSVSEAVVRHSPCPVMIVRGKS